MTVALLIGHLFLSRHQKWGLYNFFRQWWGIHQGCCLNQQPITTPAGQLSSAGPNLTFWCSLCCTASYKAESPGGLLWNHSVSLLHPQCSCWWLPRNQGQYLYFFRYLCNSEMGIMLSESDEPVKELWKNLKNCRHCYYSMTIILYSSWASMIQGEGARDITLEYLAGSEGK